jgi:hypothetical protein
VTPLRIALVAQTPGPADVLAEALRRSGHRADLIHGASLRAADALLARRGFSVPLTPVPSAAAALLRGGYDIAHAFSPADGAAARAWRRVAGGPVVYTCGEVLERGSLANGRLRLALLQGAIERSDARVAADDEIAASLVRWLAVEAEVIPGDDADTHARLYARLVALRAR